MSNRLQQHFQKTPHTLAIYFTAGYPKLESTHHILKLLDQLPVGLIEIGMPFSDPLADGLVIQQSSQKALSNGMSISILFKQLQTLRRITQKPVVLMGYLNPVMQIGVERFLQQCQDCGIDGLILPDLPPEMYEKHYDALFKQYSIKAVFLVTPQTKPERIRMIDELSGSFIYAVSSASTTGGQSDFGQYERNYFERLSAMHLKNPVLIGFGIRNREQLSSTFKFASGGIIGSAFIQQIDATSADLGIPAFINQIYPQQ